VDLETRFILLFVIATAVAIAVRRLYVPYTVALVIAGLVLGGLHLFPAPHLTQELLYTIFLPGLLFEAAFHIEFEDFWRNRIAISALAVPGVIASTVLVALMLAPLGHELHVLPGFGWREALVFGALISATDPIAVVSLFRTLGAPRRLTTLLESESLLNDGTSIVFFTLSLGVATGSVVHPGAIAVQFVTIVGMGAAIGAFIGAVASIVMRQVNDPMIEITLTTMAAYGSFVCAQTLHSSGVIATVAAGMICGNIGSRSAMSASTRVAANSFWEYVAFALNSIVFLLIGFSVRLSVLLTYWLPIVLAYLVVTASRALVVSGSCALLAPTREHFPWRWTPVLTWGGLRGALPMVLALSLPQDFPFREALVAMTFGVAILSILIQGTTASTLIRRSGLGGYPSTQLSYQVQRGQVLAAESALRELERLSRRGQTSDELVHHLRDEYRRRLEGAGAQLRQRQLDPDRLHLNELTRLRRQLLFAERDQVMQSYYQGLFDLQGRDQLLSDIDSRMLQLQTGQSADATTSNTSSNKAVTAADRASGSV
jgi:CPA1 family monovalent cation:H+ antiporter